MRHAIRLRLAPVVACLLAAPAAQASDFMDTRLTFTMGDDDVLHQTGQAQPLSPNFNLGDRSQYRLFFDNLNSRFSGRENVSHLVMYKKMPGYVEHLDTEASLVLRVDLSALSANTNNVNSAFYDAGSYIRLVYHTQSAPERAREGVSLTLFPLDTDRFRLGYLYDLSWGGTNASINQSIFPRLQGSSPGAKLQIDGERFYVFGGFKAASIVQPEQAIAPGTSDVETVRLAQTNYGLLGGAGVDPLDNLRVEAGTGYFQQGKFDLDTVVGKRIYTYGFSGRVVVHDKMPVPQSVDFLLYRNDPNAPMNLFQRDKYAAGTLAWAVSAEATQLEQNLKDFDHSGATRLQAARAGAVQGNVKYGFLRASVTGIYRDVPFILRNQPGYIPFQTIPYDAKVTAERFFAGSLDYYFEKLHLLPAIGGGVQLPATFGSDSVALFTSRTVVIRQQGSYSILPPGASAKPILQARASLRWDISDLMSAVAWVQLVHDPNGTYLELNPDGTSSERQFISSNFLGFGTSMQARF